MSKRRNHDAGFKARVALEAVKGERTPELTSATTPLPYLESPSPKAAPRSFAAARRS